MKKSISLLLTCAMAGYASLWADSVSPQRASEIATKYVAATPSAPAGLASTKVEKINGNLYLVHFSPVGYAIVSADDNADPIIAYSTESNITPSRMPENMAFMVNEASMGVDYRISAGKKSNRWTQIESGAAVRSRAAEPVENLITVNWNQSAPYNKYCPGKDKGQAIVGCVAVAMSQAMSVQQYPIKPQGQVTYASPNYGQLSIDFDKEKEYDWKAILNGSNNYDEVARLLYHAGMSVNMDYGTDGSGIPSNQVYRITNALKNNFGYPDVAYYQRDNYKGDWAQLLLNELTAGHALVYNAIDSKGGYGHSFNIDGYDGSSLFHLNWGWGGIGNGFFSINSLQDAQMNMNYDSWHYAVTGIGAANSPIRNIQLSDLVVESDTPVGSAFTALLVNGEVPNSSMSVEITGEYRSSDKTYADIPFQYKNGILSLKEDLKAYEGKSIYVRIVVTMKVEGKSRTLTQGYYVQVTPPQGIESRTSVSYDRASKKFTVHSKFGASYIVKNSKGEVITQGTISEIPTFEFNRAQLSAGTNTIEVSSNGKTKVVNIEI